MNFYDNFHSKKNLLAAHRGHRAIRPENTFSAFEVCLGQCDFIEFDVAMSKDGIVIIIHDDSVIRTSNIKENNSLKDKTRVCDFTYEELLQLDFSSWFIKKDPFNSIKNKKIKVSEIKKESILSLKELLVFCKKNMLYANIEIKDLEKTPFNRVIVKEVLKIIQETQTKKMVLISSINHEYLKETKILAPDISTAALVDKQHPLDLLKYLNALDVCAYHCKDNLINKEIITLLKKNNYKVCIYTVNEAKRKKELFSLGVDGIFTDFL